ncbi:PaaX family transcriptional regulator [Actinospica durhamensis]|uniref:PaaX family transcriptional regulator n=1 Tax=Actinospica durhamensis TaxID=1508375 RepID=A0A941IT72_9ACTN|nr:PaaX family transcriptional regulator C-terminal domain-containing protein [Actinospica durhamensis]MBR7839369.1 PaaX family transcriptional regulator [Actinospica durhamensis]
MTTEVSGPAAAASAEEPAGRERESRLGPLILTVFGLYARSEDDWLSVASLVRLMAELGLDERAVRSAISRLKRRGVLRPERHGKAAGYSLETATLEVLAEGDSRIFERVRAVAEDGWLLVVFSVPESEREKRHELRATLTRLGFGTAAPGVWIAPGNLADETRRTLERRKLTGYVDIFHGDHIAFGEPRSKVRQWWDLDELAGLYADFSRQYRPVHDRTQAEGVAPHEAFQTYIPMLTQWRRLPYRDPGLPLRLLPPGWSGESAGLLFDALNRTLSGPAREHAMAVIHAEG